MDRIANVVGLSPENSGGAIFLRPGQTTTTEQSDPRTDQSVRSIGQIFGARPAMRKKNGNFLSKTKQAPRRGMGIAAFLHGAGFTGSGEPT